MLADDYATAAVRLQCAAQDFAHCGDWCNHWLAQAHLMLSYLGAGRLSGHEEMVEQIGAWGAQRGSFSYALGLGILLNRAGRHWLTRVGDYERALACYRLAATLFARLGASVNRSQSLVDQGTVYQAVGERATGITYYEAALDLLEESLQARPKIANQLTLRAIMLAVTIYQLYLQQTDSPGMRSSADRIDVLIACRPTVPCLSNCQAPVNTRSLLTL